MFPILCEILLGRLEVVNTVKHSLQKGFLIPVIHVALLMQESFVSSRQHFVDICIPTNGSLLFHSS